MNLGGGVRHRSMEPNKDVNLSTLYSLSHTLLSELDRLNAETISAGREAHRSPCEPHKGLTGGWIGGSWLSLELCGTPLRK